jgi:hypothetical protein
VVLDCRALTRSTFTETGAAITTIEITEDTKMSEMLAECGDIAEVMEALGMKRVGGLSFRRVITKAITVKRAAKIHRVPVDELLEKLDAAVAQIEAGEAGRQPERSIARVHQRKPDHGEELQLLRHLRRVDTLHRHECSIRLADNARLFQEPGRFRQDLFDPWRLWLCRCIKP